MTHYLLQRGLYPPLIHQRPSPLLGLIVVIPCYDEDFLLSSLLSLKKCDRPACDVEVIIVINESDNAPEAIKARNLHTYQEAMRWAQANNLPHFRFFPLHISDLPAKHAGVGLARKIGMDEACYRFHLAGNPGGIIACFDADSLCERNYMQALEAHFVQNPEAQACGIYFEHPLSGPDYKEEVYEAIIRYELHLRYYVHAQRWTGFPHAWQTIGSSMAVRCDAYQQQGGMNRRQAGEDFYFLHKFIPLGHFTEITSTRVIPSPRTSHRVPFGTGKAVTGILRENLTLKTYNPQSFADLRIFFKAEMPGLFSKKRIDGLEQNLPASVWQFLSNQHFEEKMAEIREHTASEEAFLKRFWRWFDAFMVMKYVHFARDNFHPDVAVEAAATWLLQEAYAGRPGNSNARELLLRFRELDRRQDKKNIC